MEIFARPVDRIRLLFPFIFLSPGIRRTSPYSGAIRTTIVRDSLPADPDAAHQLAEVELSERLSESKLSSVSAQSPGPKTWK